MNEDKVDKGILIGMTIMVYIYTIITFVWWIR